MASNTFFYYAYGSNLLKERIHLNTECQFKFKCVAKLENWKLTFKSCGDSWMGGSANIFENDGDCVWGVVWETDSEGMKKLDKQEAVDKGIHERIQIEVESADEKILCNSYRMVDTKDNFCAPSPHYKDVILRGAKQSKLPHDYLLKLQNIPDNGFKGKVPNYDALGLSLE